MKKQFYYLLIGIIYILSSYQPLFTCNNIKDNIQVNLFSSYQDNYLGSYSQQSVIINGCKSQVDKYLMIASGPIITNLQYINLASFNGKYTADKCWFNPNLYELDYDYYKTNIERDFKENEKILNLCLVKKVKSSNIYAPPDQEFCQIDPINDHQLNLRGSLCFLEINPDSNFQIDFELDEKCKQKEYL